MRQPSAARQRTLDLQARAIRFSADVNLAYPGEDMIGPNLVVWGQLVRAADSASNNLVEADNASSDADFLHRMRTALREAKESKACLTKIQLSRLRGHQEVSGLEQEAGELSAIFATIILNTERRLERERKERTRLSR